MNHLFTAAHDHSWRNFPNSPRTHLFRRNKAMKIREKVTTIRDKTESIGSKPVRFKQCTDIAAASLHASKYCMHNSMPHIEHPRVDGINTVFSTRVFWSALPQRHLQIFPTSDMMLLRF